MPASNGRWRKTDVEQTSEFREKWLPLGLFLITFLTTYWAGFFWSASFFADGDSLDWTAGLLGAFAYNVPLLTILVCHEAGHYLMARRLGVPVSLPFFLPIPFVGLGTLGAVIRLRGIPQDRSALLKIGAAGPLAGGVVALVVMIVGIATSRPTPDVPMSLTDGGFVFGDSVATLAMQGLLWPGLADKGQTLLASPTFMAGWAGFLITMLNLIPIGQLDGGHVGYAVFGKTLNRLWPLVVGLCFALAVVGWFGFAVFAGIALFFGPRHFPVPDAARPLDRGARWMAVACLVMFALTFMPAPIHASGIDFARLGIQWIAGQ